VRAQLAQLEQAYYHSPAAIAGSGRGAAVTSALVPGHASSADAGTGTGWSFFCTAPTTAIVVRICPLLRMLCSVVDRLVLIACCCLTPLCRALGTRKWLPLRATTIKTAVRNRVLDCSACL